MLVLIVNQIFCWYKCLLLIHISDLLLIHISDFIESDNRVYDSDIERVMAATKPQQKVRIVFVRGLCIVRYVHL